MKYEYYKLPTDSGTYRGYKTKSNDSLFFVSPGQINSWNVKNFETIHLNEAKRNLEPEFRVNENLSRTEEITYQFENLIKSSTERD